MSVPFGQSLPPFLAELVASPPRSGGGFHLWMFSTARHLHHHWGQAEIVRLFSDAAERCGRAVPQREIQAAIDAAYAVKWTPDETTTAAPKPPRWPALNTAARAKIIGSSSMSYLGLTRESPIIVTPGDLDAEFYADELFPGNPLLCVGESSSSFTTAPREEYRGRLAVLPLVVPSPMSALTGERKSDGKQSAHTLANTGPRRWLVTEFDHGTHDDQAKVIWHLRDFAPLVLACTSGGKSLHAWWNCEGAAQAAIQRFFRYAVSLGADTATWSRSQFVRIPDGWRADKQRRQRVLFFNLCSGKAVV
jgi:hypothetical protein